MRSFASLFCGADARICFPIFTNVQFLGRSRVRARATARESRKGNVDEVCSGMSNELLVDSHEVRGNLCDAFRDSTCAGVSDRIGSDRIGLAKAQSVQFSFRCAALALIIHVVAGSFQLLLVAIVLTNLTKSTHDSADRRHSPVRKVTRIVVD